MELTFEQYDEAVNTYGSVTAAANAVGIPRETFRQRYVKLKNNWSGKSKTIVVIPDSHATHGINNDRYEWAGNLCQDVNADIVVDIGDWSDMESLCSYDKGTKGFEGRRYKKDVSVSIEAKERFKTGLGSHKLIKKACLGNHENRINRVCSDSPELDGVIDVQDLGYSEFGWDLKPLGVPHIIENIAFSHYFPSGVMNRPIGGENHAASLIKKNYLSSVCGHSHLFDYAERVRVDGSRLCAMVVGCYFDQDSDYAGHLVNQMYSRNIVVLRNVKDGSFDYEKISLEEMKRKYS